MPTHFTHNTPEALLGRNDSKNPTTTCRGLTSSGRPCRRALALPKLSPNGRRGQQTFVFSSEEVVDGQTVTVDLYCWQHKDQAQQDTPMDHQDNPSTRPVRPGRTADLFPLQERNSIDTFVQRLGIDAVTEEHDRIQQKSARRNTSTGKPSKRPQPRESAKQQRITDPAPYAEKYDFVHPERKSATKPPKKARGFWASLCCMTHSNDDYLEVVRHSKRVEQRAQPAAAKVPNPSSRAQTSTRPPKPPPPTNSPTSTLPIRPSPRPRTSSNSQTDHLLGLIPPHLSPHTTSQLLAELTKPISAHDEDGYIYIFWLTPTTQSAPAEATAHALLAPPHPQSRRISDVLTEYSFDEADDSNTNNNGDQHQTSRNRGAPRRRILLKIGRANNVARRLHEWQRQCGYALTLVRWYPYVPSSAAASPVRGGGGGGAAAAAAGRASSGGGSEGRGRVAYPDLSRLTADAAAAETVGPAAMAGEGIRKVPCVKRVERLVHLELAERQVKRRCEACGREHREWFEVDASQAGVKAVDECVRRWVAWAEERAGK